VEVCESVARPPQPTDPHLRYDRQLHKLLGRRRELRAQLVRLGPHLDAALERRLVRQPRVQAVGHAANVAVPQQGVAEAADGDDGDAASGAPPKADPVLRLKAPNLGRGR